jgi:hypothetical protein
MAYYFQKRSREFAFQAQRTFQEKNILYIGQHEYGTVYPNDSEYCKTQPCAQASVYKLH